MNDYYKQPGAMEKVRQNRDKNRERMIRRETTLANALKEFIMKELSDEGKKVFDLMGGGMRLLIKRIGKREIKLVPDPELMRFTNWTLPKEEIQVSEGCFLELQTRGWITELTKYTNGSRRGWLEMELPGKEYKVFACTQ